MHESNADFQALPQNNGMRIIRMDMRWDLRICIFLNFHRWFWNNQYLNFFSCCKKLDYFHWSMTWERAPGLLKNCWVAVGRESGTSPDTRMIRGTPQRPLGLEAPCHALQLAFWIDTWLILGASQPVEVSSGVIYPHDEILLVIWDAAIQNITEMRSVWTETGHAHLEEPSSGSSPGPWRLPWHPRFHPTCLGTVCAHPGRGQALKRLWVPSEMTPLGQNRSPERGGCIPGEAGLPGDGQHLPLGERLLMNLGAQGWLVIRN